MSALGIVSTLPDDPQELLVVDVSSWPEPRTKVSQELILPIEEIDKDSSLEYESIGDESDIFELSLTKAVNAGKQSYMIP
jgi:hypothetical protein